MHPCLYTLPLPHAHALVHKVAPCLVLFLISLFLTKGIFCQLPVSAQPLLDLSQSRQQRFRSSLELCKVTYNFIFWGNFQKYQAKPRFEASCCLFMGKTQPLSWGIVIATCEKPHYAQSQFAHCLVCCWAIPSTLVSIQPLTHQHW